MIYTSAGVEAQASSDLRSAQAIAKSNQSGQALGTAMFLSQQSMEKHLKSIVLRLDEALEIGLGEGFYRKRMGHVVYSHPKDLYLECVRRIGFPRGLDDRDALESAYPGFYEDVKAGHDFFEKLGKTWDSKFFGKRTQELALQHSLRSPLPDSELQELDKYAHNVLENVYRDRDFEVIVSKFANEEPRADMAPIVLDESLLARSRSLYAGQVRRVNERSNSENLFVEGAQKMKNVRKQIKAGEMSSEHAKRLVRIEMVEYAIPGLVEFSRPYLRTYPHHELGRYPQKLGSGKMTTDIYAAQRNDVLYELFVVADYNHARMTHVSRHVGDFCRIYNSVG